MAKWEYIEIEKNKPSGGNVLGGFLGPTAYYIDYSNTGEMQKMKVEQVEPFIKQLLDDGWEPFAVSQTMSEGFWGNKTWSFKKKLE